MASAPTMARLAGKVYLLVDKPGEPGMAAVSIDKLKAASDQAELAVQQLAARTSPDCAAGKHPACTGDAWDLSRDEQCNCMCTCHDLSPASFRGIVAGGVAPG